MKLLKHPFTDEDVCLKCMTVSGFFSREISQDALPERRERRGNIRIPVSIMMEFDIPSSKKGAVVTNPALSVNLSTAGICFAWEHCAACAGYTEGSVHPDCMFYPYYIHNDSAKELGLTFNLTQDYSMEIPCRIVYTIQEKEMDIEYVGACFSKVSEEERLMLEIIIHKYGKLS